MDYTQSIGNVNELQCISKFIEMGFQCSIPYGNSAKYDFIADLGEGELIRVQCKASTYARSGGVQDLNAFSFNCASQTTNTKKTTRHTYSYKDIDYFCTFFNNNVYLIPVEECSISKTLRFAPPRNGKNNYNKAEDYLIENILGHLKDQKFEKAMQEHQKQVCPNNKSNLPIEYLCTQCHENYTTIKNGICLKCLERERVNSRVVKERPSREELKQMIRKESFLAIGKKFNVTDNAIRKWCRAVNLPEKKTEIKKYTDEEWKLI